MPDDSRDGPGRLRAGPGRTLQRGDGGGEAGGITGVQFQREHPAAADTVGIRVRATRYRNVILGGLLTGIGGACLTIGSDGSFGKDMSYGMGYITLAAMIFGRWTPLGGVGASLLFGFTFALQSILSTINVPIPSDIALMAPYLATIVAVAGLVGRVRPPGADGQPYVKA